MSAYVVSKAHIDALVTAALQYARRDRSADFRWYTWPNEDSFEAHTLSEDNANEIGSVLWQENVRSVEARYEREETANGADALLYRFARLATPLTDAEVIDAISGFEYQTCEHREWRAANNRVRAFCEALRRRAAQALASTAGADMWSVPADRPTVNVYQRSGR